MRWLPRRVANTNKFPLAPRSRSGSLSASFCWPSAAWPGPSTAVRAVRAARSSCAAATTTTAPRTSRTTTSAAGVSRGRCRRRTSSRASSTSLSFSRRREARPNRSRAGRPAFRSGRGSTDGRRRRWRGCFRTCWAGAATERATTTATTVRAAPNRGSPRCERTHRTRDERNPEGLLRFSHRIRTHKPHAHRTGPDRHSHPCSVARIVFYMLCMR
mmetsp:Transcript_116570/g.238448  ORF Transcript_116570/g.238448 Transcript_116570/m.238448 type:complete len:215 (+) Transcript_116570:300-944(+)